MPDWAAFAGVAGAVTVLVLFLARASESLLSGGAESTAETGWEGTGFEPATVADGDGDAATTSVDSDASAVNADTTTVNTETTTVDTDTMAADAETTTVDADTTSVNVDHPPNRVDDPAITDLPTSTLLLNVAATQAFFGLFLLGGVWYAQIPLSALGLAVPARTDLALGVGLGVVVFALNQVAARAGRRFGLGGGEELRRALAPDSVAGWVLLLGVVLPVVAGFEELLFRGALVGGLAAGFGLPVGLLAVVSSGAFALGHGAQGRVGIVVTGLLGLVFAGAFVVTGSLVVVVVAHYLVNALEFVVHEGVGGR